MKRLLTFGCSFTGYEFPTWAHLLADSYDEFENWGAMGVGNRAIAERIAEALAHGKIDQDTTVVVQWTTPYRHDFHKQVMQGMPWRTRGNLFNQPDLYDRRWVENFYDPNSYLMHSLNHMILAQELLANTGCTWYMTSIEDYSRLIEQHPSLRRYNWQRYPDKWLPLLTPVDPKLSWNSIDNTENHPGILQYLQWLKTTPLPLTESADTWARELETLYKTSAHREDLLYKIRTHRYKTIWPHPLHGL